MSEIVQTVKSKIDLKQAAVFAKWLVIPIFVGLLVGLVGSTFCLCLSFATKLRTGSPWLMYLLPVAGLAIVALYKYFKNENDKGTNQVISAVNGDDSLPFRMAPLIYISTLLTHMFGGSAGREGAALQIGGSIGHTMGRMMNFTGSENRIMIMCGMSAAFASVFGTPMAAAVFSIEMITVGVMQYTALLPCVIASLTGRGVAILLGVGAESFTIPSVTAFGVKTAIIIAILAAICALFSILFCETMHFAGATYKRFIKNPYIRVFVGGCIIVVMTLMVGSQTYNGSGVNIIEECFEGEVVPYAFILKLLFTALCMGAGFKGGEIVPAFTCGAALGCLFGNITGFNPALCSAVGMIAVFCGATNCPLASLLIAFEMFGFEGMPYYLITIAISFLFSGKASLYHTQKFAAPKSIIAK